MLLKKIKSKRAITPLWTNCLRRLLTCIILFSKYTLIPILNEIRSSKTQQCAYFQVKKNHIFVICKWIATVFYEQHPRIHIYTHTKIQWNRPKQFRDTTPLTKLFRTIWRKEERTDGQRSIDNTAGNKIGTTLPSV